MIVFDILQIFLHNNIMPGNFTPLHIEDSDGKKLHTVLIGMSLLLVVALGLLVWYLVVQQQQKEATLKSTPKSQPQTAEQVPGENEPQTPVSTPSAQPTASPSASLSPTDTPILTASPTATPSGIMNQ